MLDDHRNPKPRKGSSKSHFFLAAVKVIYTKDEVFKERTLNVLLELETPEITQQVLRETHNAALSRLETETGIPKTDVKDTVFENFPYLGHMKPEAFHAKSS